LAKRASERFREIAVIKSRTNRFIWPAAVEGTKSRFVRFKTKDDLLKQVGTALVTDFPALRKTFVHSGRILLNRRRSDFRARFPHGELLALVIAGHSPEI
jgi:hypothetical protein